jgi:hypothetical protein
MSSDGLYRAVLWTQGLYFSITGLWPLVDIESFQKVTGRKTDHLITGKEGDHWLVMCVGALITALAIGFLYAAWKGRRTTEVAVFALTSAFALTIIDIVFVARGTISTIYLIDAVAEVLLVVVWCVVLTQRIRQRSNHQ